MKVAIIGGGSYAWAFGFTRQFVKSDKLSNIELVLMDIDSERLADLKKAGDVFNKANGSTIKLKATTVLDEALDGANFVIVSISTGGFDTMQHDLAIPEKYGIYHTVGDTVGPGGWLRAVRNIPVFDNFAARMKVLCPDAWMINVTNPLTPLTRTPERNYGIKTVGLCPSIHNSARSLALMAGADLDARVDYIVTGIDHGSWFTKLYADGFDVLQRLKDLGFYTSDDNIPFEAAMNDPLADDDHIRAGFAVWREIGYLPSIPDRHTTENWSWFEAADSPELPFGIERTSIEQRWKWYYEKRDKIKKYGATGDESIVEHQGHGDDPIVTVIEALSGKRTFTVGANYTNLGQTPELPLGAVVETRCVFDAAGVHPLTSPMPDILKTLVYPQVVRQEMIIDIALSGNIDELVALIMTDSLCCRLKMGECRNMVKEMLLATKAYIQNPKLLEF